MTHENAMCRQVAAFNPERETLNREPIFGTAPGETPARHLSIRIVGMSIPESGLQIRYDRMLQIGKWI
jgi:hypothetical protein